MATLVVVGTTGATSANVARRGVCFGYAGGVSKRKNKELSQLPAPPVEQVLNDFMIDMKVEELRHTISMLACLSHLGPLKGPNSH